MGGGGGGVSGGSHFRKITPKDHLKKKGKSGRESRAETKDCESERGWSGGESVSSEAERKACRQLLKGKPSWPPGKTAQRT